MLFHITHTHDEHTCPAHDAEVMSRPFAVVVDSLKENVNEVHGVWVDPPGHQFFMVVEADDTAQIFAGLFPIFNSGTAEIKPVGDFDAMMEKRKELMSQQ